MCAFFLVEGQCPKNGSDYVGLHGHSLFFAGPLRFGQGDAWVWVKLRRVPKNRMVYSRNEKHLRSCKAQFWSHTHIIHSFKTENLQTGVWQAPNPKKGTRCKVERHTQRRTFCKWLRVKSARSYQLHLRSRTPVSWWWRLAPLADRKLLLAARASATLKPGRRKLLPGSNITRLLCVLQSSTWCNVYIPW